jgi:hypothetical protein
MSQARARPRTDSNQAALVKTIRSMGASWQPTHAIPGALDGIIGYRGVDVRAEIKDPGQPPSKRRLTEAEEKTINEWRGRPPVVIEINQHIIELFMQINREKLKEFEL